MKKWFENTLKKIMEYNEYPEGALTVEACTAINKWTPCDLIAREYLNNGGGSAKGFLGLYPYQCKKAYDYMCEIKQELIEKGMVNKEAWNNSGFPLWDNYEFDR